MKHTERTKVRENIRSNQLPKCHHACVLLWDTLGTGFKIPEIRGLAVFGQHTRTAGHAKILPHPHDCAMVATGF